MNLSMVDYQLNSLDLILIMVHWHFPLVFHLVLDYHITVDENKQTIPHSTNNLVAIIKLKLLVYLKSI